MTAWHGACEGVRHGVRIARFWLARVKTAPGWECLVGSESTGQHAHCHLPPAHEHEQKLARSCLSKPSTQWSTPGAMKPSGLSLQSVEGSQDIRASAELSPADLRHVVARQRELVLELEWNAILIALDSAVQQQQPSRVRHWSL